LGIGIVGFGRVARKWHLTAYKKYGLPVVAICDVLPEARACAAEQAPGAAVFDSVEGLLSCRDVAVVDIATGPVGRLALLWNVLEAGKHALIQKPVVHELAGLRAAIEETAQRRLKVAVNQNGRWAPPWRLAHLLIREGWIGNVQAVSHLYDLRMTWRPDVAQHGTSHFLLFDYSSHWIDISRCWLENHRLLTVQARDFAATQELEDGMISQSMWLTMECEGGANAVVRGVACAHKHCGHPFWIHGTEGTIRGNVDCVAGDFVEIERDGDAVRYPLEGAWFPDGFAGSMGELLCAITEDREPSHSLADNFATIESTLAACRSAELEGMAIPIGQADGRPR
jgi:predicted dehydrogenase